MARRKSKKKKRKQTKKQEKPTGPDRVQCAVCGEWFKRITPTHVMKHGFTLDQYQRCFDVGVSPGVPPNLKPTTPKTHPLITNTVTPGDVADVGALLLKNPEFIKRLADDAAHQIFSTSLRDQFRSALCHVLGTRLELHASAVANLKKVNQELAQPWRVQEGGGVDGKPTPTPHLLGMANQFHQEVRSTEDALLKAIKMASKEAQEENRIAAGLTGGHLKSGQIGQFGHLNPDGRPAFSGEAEALPVPPQLPPGERETVRVLLGMLIEETRARSAQAPAEIQGSCEVIPEKPETPLNEGGATASEDDSLTCEAFPSGL